MIRKISHSVAVRAARSSSIPAQRARGVDISLGIELLSDRHVPGICKLRALAMGGAVVAMLLGGVGILIGFRRRKSPAFPRKSDFITNRNFYGLEGQPMAGSAPGGSQWSYVTRPLPLRP